MIEPQDSAERLLSVINRVLDCRNEVVSGKKIYQTELAVALPVVAEKLDYVDYMSFLQAFLGLCSVVRGDIGCLLFRRESVRETALSRIKSIEGAFDAKNFKRQADAVFNTHFSSVNKSELESISNLLQGQELTESDPRTLGDALEDAKSLANLLRESHQLSPKALNLINLHLNHLQTILLNHNSMGEQDFWASYRILFSAFVEMHETISEGAIDKGDYNIKLRRMLERLLLGSSLAANAITISSPVIQFLT